MVCHERGSACECDGGEMSSDWCLPPNIGDTVIKCLLCLLFASVFSACFSFEVEAVGVS